MNKNKELVSNTIIIFIGKFCTQFITLLLLPLYTYYLTTEDYGYIDLIQTYLIFFIPLILLKIDAGIFRFLIDARDNEEAKAKIISNGIFTMLVQLLVMTIIYSVVIQLVYVKYNILILINLISLSVLTFLLQIIRGVGKNKQYSYSSMIAAVVTILLNILFLVILNKTGEYVLVASFISNLFCIIYLIFSDNVLKYIKIKYFDKRVIKDLLKYSIPMIPNELSWWIVHVSDRSIISYVLGVAANGIYSVSCKFSNILSSIFNIFNLSWQESASLHINDDDRDEFFSDVINKVFNLFISICIGIITCMPFMFKIFIKDTYADAYNYIPILLLANIFNVLIGLIGAIYIAKKMTKEVAKTTVLAATINLATNIVLVKAIGIYAAAISTLIAYVALAIYRYIAVQKYVKVKLSKKDILINCLVFIVAVILYYNNNIILNTFSLIMAIAYFIVINRKILLEGKKMLIKRLRKII